MNYSVLPFYENEEHRHNKIWYNWGHIYPLVSSNKRVLPFTIIIPATATTISKFEIVDHNTGGVTDITSEMVTAGLVKVSESGFDVIKNPSHVDMGSVDMGEGRRYAIITMSDDKEYYSEIFTSTHQYVNLSKIEFWNENDDPLEWSGGKIDYNYPFRNYFYVNAIEGKPEYQTIEVGEERDGYFFYEKIISKKLIKFVFPVPEYLQDIIAQINLHTYIRLHDGINTYYVQKFEFKEQWEENGTLSFTEITLHIDNIRKVIGRKTLIIDGDYGSTYDDSYDTGS